MTNALYYGDNLTVLRESIATESVDLIYLDPPFNSNASYNVLFKHHPASSRKRKLKRSKTLGIGRPITERS
jgi:16S rRNA G966 N2-methylase RsmD